ncbi:hypothetical protein ACIRPK_29685 [Kitasatospora sp. NPDC101801]|uniref:hypothetical protein n=1 Tax=Kitasatospora sp. NPDC101801 TaxID=3364103 RepID=UPI003822B5A7
MRTPVINRFAKIVPLVAVATLTAGLTVLPASTAWACGDEPAPGAEPVPAATDTWEKHATDPVATFVPGGPDKITVGGPKVEFSVELYNGTGEDYRRVAPGLGLWNPQSGDPSNHLPNVNLRPEDITVEVMVDGGWKNLTLQHSCDPALYTDIEVARGPLADGHAKRFLFRLGLKSSTPVEQTSLEIYSAFTLKPTSLTMVRPPATPKPTTPKATPATPKPTTPKATPASATPSAPVAAPAAVPAAAKDAPAATPTPAAVAAAPVAELAETGSTTPNTFLLASAAAMVALGTGVLLMVRRTRRTRG